MANKAAVYRGQQYFSFSFHEHHFVEEISG